jgi:hypothetical protein
MRKKKKGISVTYKCFFHLKKKYIYIYIYIYERKKKKKKKKKERKKEKKRKKEKDYNMGKYHTLCKEHPLSNDSFEPGECSLISPNNISANDRPPDID